MSALARLLTDQTAPVRSHFLARRGGLAGLLSSGINFCPWCGKELEFLEEGTVQSRVRSAKA